MKDEIGFIGLGLMGLAMTRRLLRAGQRVIVWNRTAARTALALEEGATAAPSPEAVAARSAVTLICVTDASTVEAIVFGPGGIAAGLRQNGLVVDHSSIDPQATRLMAKRLKAETGAGWVDAPVAGGAAWAEAGTLAMMVGGAPEDVERARPLLLELSQRPTHMGPVGAGQTAKLCNQLIGSCTLAVLAETTRLALNAGIDAALLPACFKGGLADSALLPLAVPRFLQRKFTPPMAHARTMMKDIDNLLELARQTATAVPMAACAAQQYRQLIARGGAELEPTAIIMLSDPMPLVHQADEQAR